MVWVSGAPAAPVTAPILRSLTRYVLQQLHCCNPQGYMITLSMFAGRFDRLVAVGRSHKRALGGLGETKLGDRQASLTEWGGIFCFVFGTHAYYHILWRLSYFMYAMLVI